MLGVVAVVASCGGGSVTAATTGGGDAPVTKAQFVKKGDQICRLNYTEREKVLFEYLEKVKKEGGAPPLAKQEELLVTRILPIFKEESQELDELPLPTSETRNAKAILKALAAAIAAVESHPGVAVRNGMSVLFAHVEALAHAYGFEYCGRS
jgi:hypothetical protein